MRWSKIKQQVESRLAASVAGRIRFHNAGYRWHHEADGRIWITVDGDEIASFCTQSYQNQKARLVDDLEACKKVSGPGHRDLSATAIEAEQLLGRRGILTRSQARNDLESYLGLSVEAAVVSESPLHLAIAVLDRRFGKRRLAAYVLPATAPAFVHKLLAVRLEAEGLAAEDLEASAASPRAS